MSTWIKASVGKGGTNNPADVKLVQSRLSVYAAAGLLGSRGPLAVDGNVAATIPYIEDFQKLVMGFSTVDGKVDVPPGKTITRLMTDPPDPFGIIKCNALALKNKVLGTVGDVPSDVWQISLSALIKYSTDPDLKRWHLLTLVDFRRSRTTERLWVVDLSERTVLIRALVAHGGGGKDAEGKLIDKQGDFADRFEDGQRFSSLGAYITLQTYLSNLGHLTQKPAMKIKGLEKGVNGRAQERGVVFHGADYVKPGSVGNSWGCFSTNPDVNPKLVETIKNGSLVFAYHATYIAA